MTHKAKDFSFSLLQSFQSPLSSLMHARALEILANLHARNVALAQSAVARKDIQAFRVARHNCNELLRIFDIEVPQKDQEAQLV